MAILAGVIAAGLGSLFAYSWWSDQPDASLPPLTVLSSASDVDRMIERVEREARGVCVIHYDRDFYPHREIPGGDRLSTDAFHDLHIFRHAWRIPDVINSSAVESGYAEIIEAHFQDGRSEAFLQRPSEHAVSRGIAGCYHTDELEFVRCPNDSQCLPAGRFVIRRRSNGAS